MKGEGHQTSKPLSPASVHCCFLQFGWISLWLWRKTSRELLLSFSPVSFTCWRMDAEHSWSRIVFCSTTYARSKKHRLPIYVAKNSCVWRLSLCFFLLFCYIPIPIWLSVKWEKTLQDIQSLEQSLTCQIRLNSSYMLLSYSFTSSSHFCLDLLLEKNDKDFHGELLAWIDRDFELCNESLQRKKSHALPLHPLASRRLRRVQPGPSDQKETLEQILFDCR